MNSQHFDSEDDDYIAAIDLTTTTSKNKETKINTEADLEDKILSELNSIKINSLEYFEECLYKFLYWNKLPLSQESFEKQLLLCVIQYKEFLAKKPFYCTFETYLNEYINE